jgi:hypothetical protein
MPFTINGVVSVVTVSAGGAEVVELPRPRDLEVLDVLLVDLIEGGIARTALLS